MTTPVPPRTDAGNGSGEATPNLIRSLNLRTVLDTIAAADELSRPEIAALTGLSLPTAASLIAELERIDLVGHRGQTIGAPGRPAALYSFNERAGYVFAVDLGSRKVTAAIADLNGSILLEATNATRRSSPGSIVDQISEMHDDLRSRVGLAKGAVGLASIGVGAVVDPVTSGLRDTNLPELQEGSFASTLEYALQIPTLIENDVNLAAIGEEWKGRAAGLTKFVVMSVGTGTGMGIVVDGEIYRGATGAAGEIARLPIGPDAADWQGNNGGLFEYTASGSGILRQLETALEGSSDPSLSKLVDVRDIFDAARAGVPEARQILDREAAQLALGVVAAAALLDPQLVVFTGGIGRQEVLVDAVNDRVASLMPSHPPIVVSQLGTRGTMYGAIAIALGAVRDQILSANSRAD